MLPATGVLFLFLLNFARCDFISEWIRTKRQSNDTDVDNSIIEVFNNCKCVYYYQCDENNYVITTGESIFSVRLKENVRRIPCKGKFQNEIVCCKLNKTESPLVTIIKTPEVDVGTNTEKDNDKNDTGPAKTVKKMPCGSQRTIINVRIFAGEDELVPIPGEFPWITAIFRKESTGYEFHCSGSLIHPKVVLTANHCVHRTQPNVFKILLDGQITLPKIGNNITEERNVLEIIHHNNYYAGGLFNDVALLILDEPYVVSKENYINTICLPPSDIKLNNTRCLVAGWGKDAHEERKRVMKKVELPFVEFNRCQDLLRQTRLGEYFNLHKSFMCAGGEEGKDACKGDGGSPLMCQFPTENRYFQIGIVSWGIGCGQVNVPGVYGDVQQFSDWIKSELRNKNLEL